MIYFLLCIYICTVEKHLDNPVYYALLSGDESLGLSVGNVKVFHEEVSPFVGFDVLNKIGFEELYTLLPARRKILYASRREILEPASWHTKHHIEGLQFLYSGKTITKSHTPGIIPLQSSHVDEMIALARLTKPGPFDKRTIEFGNYHGIFENNKLAAMTGQRLHVYNYTEISAVCTHPDYLGKGYAAALIWHQLDIILNNGQVPFLHVRADNHRAIALYERLNFEQNGAMHFYFMERRE